MGLFNDLVRTTRKVNRAVNTMEKIDRSIAEGEVAKYISQYERGEISAREFEKEVSKYVTDPNAGIKIIVQDVNGVGESTAESIASEYRSLEELEQTDRDRLESIRGVGSSTADKIFDRVQ